MKRSLRDKANQQIEDEEIAKFWAEDNEQQIRMSNEDKDLEEQIKDYKRRFSIDEYKQECPEGFEEAYEFTDENGKSCMILTEELPQNFAEELQDVVIAMQTFGFQLKQMQQSITKLSDIFTKWRINL